MFIWESTWIQYIQKAEEEDRMEQREKLSCMPFQLGLSQLHEEIWSFSGPIELSQVWTRERGIYPTISVKGYGLPLKGGETQNQAVFFR